MEATASHPKSSLIPKLLKGHQETSGMFVQVLQHQQWMDLSLVTQDAGRDTRPRASLLAAAGVVNPLAAGVWLHISSCEDFEDMKTYRII